MDFMTEEIFDGIKCYAEYSATWGHTLVAGGIYYSGIQMQLSTVMLSGIQMLLSMVTLSDIRILSAHCY